jgi:hypothetical protein
MKTTAEIKQQGFRMIDNIVTLRKNISEGCKSDEKELEVVMARLPKLIEWIKANDMAADFKHYFGSKKWGNHLQFEAFEVSKLLNTYL